MKTCPYCRGPTTEYRTNERKPGAKPDRGSKWIKTICKPCRRVIGYRPATPRQPLATKETTCESP